MPENLQWPRGSLPLSFAASSALPLAAHSSCHFKITESLAQSQDAGGPPCSGEAWGLPECSQREALDLWLPAEGPRRHLVGAWVTQSRFMLTLTMIKQRRWAGKGDRHGPRERSVFASSFAFSHVSTPWLHKETVWPSLCLQEEPSP